MLASARISERAMFACSGCLLLAFELVRVGPKCQILNILACLFGLGAAPYIRGPWGVLTLVGLLALDPQPERAPPGPLGGLTYFTVGKREEFIELFGVMQVEVAEPGRGLLALALD